MLYKKASYLSLLVIMLFGGLYFYFINSMSVGGNNTSIGPEYFPNILTIVLLVLCVISFIQTAKKKDNTIFKLNNFKYMLITLILSTLFILAWYYIGLFYIVGFLFISILTITFGKRLDIKSVLVSLLVNLLFMICIFLIFDQLMSVQL